MIRSFLFVPADSERKLDKARDVGADALILDLEDAVLAERRPLARDMVREYLETAAHTWVRINPIDTDDAVADLEAIMPGQPDGIVLPKPASADDVQKLAIALDDLESRYRIDTGSTRIIALCTERPEALLSLDSYRGASARLAGLSWGAEDLAAAVGARANRDTDGNWLPLYELARSLCLVAAAAAGVPAIDTVFTDFRDADGLARYAANARRDGFSGMLAIHPAQVEIINAAFRPSPEEVEQARRIVELFAANPGAGTLALDGRMVDRPHLVQAQRTIELADNLQNKQQG